MTRRRQSVARLDSKSLKILMLHNRYLLPGGEDISFQMEVDLLRRKGDVVDVYEEDNKRVAELGQFRTGIRSIWSVETYRKLRKILRSGSYDVMHVQNFFPLISPAAYYAAANEGVPVVQTLRNYRLQCVSGTLFRDGSPCEKCSQMAVPWAGIRHRCYRDSVSGSAAVALMIGFNKLIGTWRDKVDVYVALTDFARDQYVLGGLPEHKIMRKYNFLDPTPEPGTGAGGYALFVGRFDPVKGIETLLEGWETVAGKCPLKIVGDGPLASQVEEACRRLPDTERLPWQSPENILQLIGDARFVIIPSASYEPFGRIVAESFAKGTPVIGSRTGGLTELISDGRNGLLFEPRNAEDLAAKVRYAIENEDLLCQMRSEARREFNAEFSADVNHPQLKYIYECAIASHRGTVAHQPVKNSVEVG